MWQLHLLLLRSAEGQQLTGASPPGSRLRSLVKGAGVIEPPSDAPEKRRLKAMVYAGGRGGSRLRVGQCLAAC